MPIILVPGVGRVLKSGGGLKLGNCAACECKCDACAQGGCKDVVYTGGPCPTCNPDSVTMTVSGITVCNLACNSISPDSYRVVSGSPDGTFCLPRAGNDAYQLSVPADSVFTFDNCSGTPYTNPGLFLNYYFFYNVSSAKVSVYVALGAFEYFFRLNVGILPPCDPTCTNVYDNPFTECGTAGLPGNVGYGGTVTISPCC